MRADRVVGVEVCMIISGELRSCPRKFLGLWAIMQIKTILVIHSEVSVTTNIVFLKFPGIGE